MGIAVVIEVLGIVEGWNEVVCFFWGDRYPFAILGNVT